MYLFVGKDKDFYKVEEAEKESCKRFEVIFKGRKKIIKKMNKIVFLIGLFFSPLAALAAFLITYEEYKHHFSENKTSATKEALGTALITFLVFLTLSFLISIIINKII